MRQDGRSLDELRPFTIQPGFIKAATGSCLVTAGETRVICTASADDRVPKWLDGKGWVTAEYSMLPGATTPRGRRDPGGRGKEIQRLIGRSLRAAIELPKLLDAEGRPIAITVDCDVIEADGGTRTASITGGFVALQLAFKRLISEGRLTTSPLRGAVAAVSVGMVVPSVGGHDRPVSMLDLPYEEDSRAEVDMNVVMRRDADGLSFVEIQGTGEDGVFRMPQLQEMLSSAEAGIAQLMRAQQEAIDSAGAVGRA